MNLLDANGGTLMGNDGDIGDATSLVSRGRNGGATQKSESGFERQHDV